MPSNSPCTVCPTSVAVRSGTGARLQPTAAGLPGHRLRIRERAQGAALRRCGAQDRRSSRTRGRHRVPGPSAHAAPRHTGRTIQMSPPASTTWAQLLKATNRLSEAEPLSRRQLQIFAEFSRLSEARSTSNNSWPSGQRSYGPHLVYD
jgi:hypothetical protein